jgi:hypothetical protein
MVAICIKQAMRRHGHFGDVTDTDDRRPRVHSAQKQRLGLIEVADTGEVRLIEQRLAYRPFRIALQAAHCFGEIPVRTE